MVSHVNHVSLTGEPMDFQAVCVDTLKSGGLAKTFLDLGSVDRWQCHGSLPNRLQWQACKRSDTWLWTASDFAILRRAAFVWDLLHGIEKCLQFLSNCSGENLQSVSKCWTKHGYCEVWRLWYCWPWLLLDDWGIESIFAQAAAHCWWTWCGSCDHESGIIRHLYNSCT